MQHLATSLRGGGNASHALFNTAKQCATVSMQRTLMANSPAANFITTTERATQNASFAQLPASPHTRAHCQHMFRPNCMASTQRLRAHIGSINTKTAAKHASPQPNGIAPPFIPHAAVTAAHVPVTHNANADSLAKTRSAPTWTPHSAHEPMQQRTEPEHPNPFSGKRRGCGFLDWVGNSE